MSVQVLKGSGREIIDKYVYHVFFVFFLRLSFHSRVTGACPVTADLIMRVNVRTTTPEK